MAGQIPEFPVVNMPRMGRRNAITPSDENVPTDDAGAFSPLHLLHRASVTEVNSTDDPQNIVALSRNKDNQHQTKGDNTNKNDTADLKDASQSKRRQAVPSKAPTNVVSSKVPQNQVASKIPQNIAPSKSPQVIVSPKAPQNHASEKPPESADENQKVMLPVIPWRKHDPALSSIGEERRKIFESFNKTSIEPPETPQISEAKMQRLSKKSKAKKKQEVFRSSYESEESLDLSNPVQPKQVKSPYSSVMPKVNTRWDKNAEANASWRQQQKLVQEQFKAAKQAANIIGYAAGISGSRKQIRKASRSMSRTRTTVVKKPGPVVRPKQTSKRDTVTTLHKGKTQNGSQQNETNWIPPPPTTATKLVTNFPASENLRDSTPKLPLTIGPRFNPRKAMGMGITNSVQNRAELVGETTTRLYGTLPPYQKLKHDAQLQMQQQHPLHHGSGPGGTYKSTFFNLHRINNAGVSNNKAGSNAIGQGLVVVRHPNPDGIGGAISVEIRKSAPPLTTIQAPPSPFMNSVISIPSQLNEIPVNGELPATPVQPTSSDNDNRSARSGKRGSVKTKRDSVNRNKFQYYRPNNKVLNPGKMISSNKNPSGKPMPNKAGNTVGVLQPATLTAAGGRLTVVPTLGPVPNKYNNIYIGPYSGSESEGELHATKKTR